jgi:hypothetical protein
MRWRRNDASRGVAGAVPWRRRCFPDPGRRCRRARWVRRSGTRSSSTRISTSPARPWTAHTGRAERGAVPDWNAASPRSYRPLARVLRS